MLLATCLLIGCGSGAGKNSSRVNVTVTYGGEPITEGRVDLSNPKSGQGGGGDLNSSGQVRIDNIPHGDYVVTVIPPMPDPRPPEPGQRPTPPKEYPNIPKIYRIASTSPLNANVNDKSTDFKFELKK